MGPLSPIPAATRAERRVLVCFKRPRDGALVCEMLRRIGVEALVCGDTRELCREIEGGLGCLIVGEEVLTVASTRALGHLLDAQPNWSAVPVLVVVPRAAATLATAPALMALKNLTLLESPLGVTAFNTAVAAALAGRDRQLAVKGHIEEREQVIRQRDEALAALAQSRHELLLENRKKDEFLATLAHELRNPLAPIRNGVAIIAHDKNLDAKTDWARGIIERQVGALSRLIDDLLDVSRLRSGKVKLQRKVCRVADVLSAAVETSLPGVTAAALQLVFHPVDPGLEFKVDPLRIAQAVSNLINNAVKFTPTPGTIEVSGRRDGQCVVLSVKDTGIGIAEEHLEQIFDLFSQLRASGSRQNTGLGIGLTLVKSFAQLHGGEARALSAGSGRGSEFQIRLPARPAPLPAAVAAPLPARRSAAERRLEATAAAPRRRSLRILVVDDNRDAAESLRVVLAMCGHTTELAFDGASAIALEANFDPEVIVMDLGMPGIDGFAAGTTIRTRNPRCVLIAASGWGREQDRARSSAAGFDHHFVKPVDLARLTEILNRLHAPEVEL